MFCRVVSAQTGHYYFAKLTNALKMTIKLIFQYSYKFLNLHPASKLLLLFSVI